MRRNRKKKVPAIDLDWANDRQILPPLVDSNSKRIEDLFDKILEALAAALNARRIARPTKGIRAVLEIGRDHAVALKGARRFIKMMTSGRPRPLPACGDSREYIYDVGDFQIAIAADAADADPGDKHQARLEVERKYKRPWKVKPVDPPPPTLPSLVAARRELLQVLFERALQAQEEAAGARQTIFPYRRTRHLSVAIDLGPDHRVAGAAADIVFEIMTAGRATPERPEPVAQEESIEEIRDRVYRVLTRAEAEREAEESSTAESIQE